MHLASLQTCCAISELADWTHRRRQPALMGPLQPIRTEAPGLTGVFNQSWSQHHTSRASHSFAPVAWLFSSQLIAAARFACYILERLPRFCLSSDLGLQIILLFRSANCISVFANHIYRIRESFTILHRFEALHGCAVRNEVILESVRAPFVLFDSVLGFFHLPRTQVRYNSTPRHLLSLLVYLDCLHSTDAFLRALSQIGRTETFHTATPTKASSIHHRFVTSPSSSQHAVLFYRHASPHRSLVF